MYDRQWYGKQQYQTLLQKNCMQYFIFVLHSPQTYFHYLEKPRPILKRRLFSGMNNVRHQQKLSQKCVV